MSYLRSINTAEEVRRVKIPDSLVLRGWPASVGLSTKLVYSLYNNWRNRLYAVYFWSRFVVHKFSFRFGTCEHCLGGGINTVHDSRRKAWSTPTRCELVVRLQPHLLVLIMYIPYQHIYGSVGQVPLIGATERLPAFCWSGDMQLN